MVLFSNTTFTISAISVLSRNNIHVSAFLDHAIKARPPEETKPDLNVEILISHKLSSKQKKNLFNQ